MANVQFTGNTKPSGSIVKEPDGTLTVQLDINQITNYSSVTSGNISFSVLLTTAPYTGGPISGFVVDNIVLSPAQLGPDQVITVNPVGPDTELPEPSASGVYNEVLTIQENGSSTPDAVASLGHIEFGDPGPAIGTGSNFSGLAEQDVFHRLSSGQLIVSETANGSALDTIPFTYQGQPWTVDPSATAIGVGQDFWAYSGHDVFLRSGTGQLYAEEFATDGSAIDAQALTYQGQPWTIDAATTALGAGLGFWGYGGHDVFLRSGSGQLYAEEFDSNGHAIDSLALTYQGQPWTVAASATAIGAAQDFWGYGGHDVFIRSGTGQLYAEEFDANGHAIDSQALTYQGQAWTVDASATAIGAGQGFWGYGGHDVFIRSSTGQLSAEEFDSNGHAIDSLALTYQGQPWLIDASTTAIGTGQGFWAYGDHDVFLRTGTGQLYAEEFDSNGQAVDARALTYQGQPWTIDASTTAIGAGGNFWGFNGGDVFLRSGTGQLYAEEFDGNGQAIDAQALTYQGQPWLIDASTTAIGAGQNFWGQGGHDVFLRAGNGQLLAQEFDSNGHAIDAQALTYQGQPWTVDAATSAIGAAQNFWGAGGHDVFLRAGNGQLLAQEFASNGQALEALGLTLGNGAAATVDTTTSVVGTSSNLLGHGGRDILFADLGQSHIWEVSSSGIVLAQT